MVWWNFLPTELISDIVSRELNQHDLRNLSLVSRQLHDIVEPILYTRISFKDKAQYVEQVEPSNPLHTSTCRSRMRQFMRTITNRPELCSRVIALDLGPITEENTVTKANTLLVQHMMMPFYTIPQEPSSLEAFYASKTQSSAQGYIILAKACEKVGLGTNWIIRGDDIILMDGVDPNCRGEGFSFEQWGLSLLILHHLPRLQTLELSSAASQVFMKNLIHHFHHNPHASYPRLLCLSNLATLIIDHHPPEIFKTGNLHLNPGEFLSLR